jgi:hypothetical protein
MTFSWKCKGHNKLTGGRTVWWKGQHLMKNSEIAKGPHFWGQRIQHHRTSSCCRPLSFVHGQSSTLLLTDVFPFFRWIILSRIRMEPKKKFHFKKSGLSLKKSTNSSSVVFSTSNAKPFSSLQVNENWKIQNYAYPSNLSFAISNLWFFATCKISHLSRVKPYRSTRTRVSWPTFFNPIRVCLAILLPRKLPLCSQSSLYLSTSNIFSLNEVVYRAISNASAPAAPSPQPQPQPPPVFKPQSITPSQNPIFAGLISPEHDFDDDFDEFDFNLKSESFGEFLKSFFFVCTYIYHLYSCLSYQTSTILSSCCVVSASFFSCVNLAFSIPRFYSHI